MGDDIRGETELGLSDRQIDQPEPAGDDEDTSEYGQQLEPLPPGIGKGLVEEGAHVKGAKAKRGYTKWTPEGEKLLRELYLQGRKAPELCKVFGICRQTLYNKVEVMGLKEERNQLESRVSARLATMMQINRESEQAPAVRNHSKFLGKCSLGSLRMLEKALMMGDQATNARDLSASVNAAAKAAAMYREANDIGSSSGRGVFNFTLIAASPLRGQEPMKRAEVVES